MTTVSPGPQYWLPKVFFKTAAGIISGGPVVISGSDNGSGTKQVLYPNPSAMLFATQEI